MLDIEFDGANFERLSELVNSHPISMDGIVQIAEVAAETSRYGISTEQMCDMLKDATSRRFPHVFDDLWGKEA